LLNELKTSLTFYEWWAIEYEIRSMASKYKHTYTIALFGCCREIYSPIKHKGYVSGTLIQALMKFDRAEHQAQL
jgi:hypothetical protein